MIVGALESYADRRKLRWCLEIRPEESHGSIMHRGMQDGLEFVFRAYRPNKVEWSYAMGLGSLEQRWSWVSMQVDRISKFYGQDAADTQLASISSDFASRMAWGPQTRDKPAAIELLQRCVELLPTEPRLQMQLERLQNSQARSSL